MVIYEKEQPCKTITTGIIPSYSVCTYFPCVPSGGIDIHEPKEKSPSGDNPMVITYKQKKTSYCTKKKAGETAEIPAFLPVITNRKYQSAITFRPNDNAFLQLLVDGNKLKYRQGLSYLGSLAATYTNIKNDLTSAGIEKINLPLLRIIYGILLCRFSALPKVSLDGTTIIYYPDLAKRLGKPNPGTKDIKAVTNAMERLENIVGIINNGSRASDILPVLSNYKYDSDTNTISFASPYIARIIKEIDKESIRKDKKGNPMLNKDGTAKKLPAYSYLVDISIEKERNKKAVEVVLIIVALIEQAGNNTPHIRASTIVERAGLFGGNPQGLPTGSKNTVLKRTFSRAWNLLRSKTLLSSVYKDLWLPDSNDTRYIPTCSTLDMVFAFTHAGKNSDSKSPS